jgi:hypothetical protein
MRAPTAALEVGAGSCALAGASCAKTVSDVKAAVEDKGTRRENGELCMSEGSGEGRWEIV